MARSSSSKEPDLQKALAGLETEALMVMDEASSKEALIQAKARFLGKKGELSSVLRGLGDLPEEKRPLVGKIANEIRDRLEQRIQLKTEELLKKEQQAQIVGATIDRSLPGRVQEFGSLHPLTQTSRDILSVLSGLGFKKAVGPEIEHDFYNFEALNVPQSHPARDMQDTFYIAPDVLLRTHTSPVQIRAMLLSKKPPLRVTSFGRVYRRDEDATHSPMFHQIEGLYVDKAVSLSDLKGTLKAFVEGVFSKEEKIRLRPSFFPFTEPSIEVDVSCVMCRGAGCRLCKHSGWLEILGAGMVDPAVFTAVGYDPEQVSGFAFGLGVERVAMLRYGIPDIRLFFENDLRFLRQF